MQYQNGGKFENFKKNCKKNSHCVNGRKQKIAEILIAVSVYFQLKIMILIIIMMMMIRIWAIEKPVNPNSPVFKFEQTPISELRASMENVGTTPLELGLISHSRYMNIYSYDTPSKRTFLTEKAPFWMPYIEQWYTLHMPTFKRATVCKYQPKSTFCGTSSKFEFRSFLTHR